MLSELLNKDLSDKGLIRLSRNAEDEEEDDEQNSDLARRRKSRKTEKV